MDKTVVDADWLPFHPQPRKPEFRPPIGAVDAHCHVFGPGDEFPFAAERKYTPCDASKHQLWALRDHLGFTRNVVVQATCHGKDNRALIDALESSDGMARGVATIGTDITDDELQKLNRAGVRGVRFNFVKRLVDSVPYADLESIAARIKPLGWHVVIYFEAQDLAEHQDFFTSLSATIVFDHMGRPDVSKAVDGAEFQRFAMMLQDYQNLWTKVTCPERLSISGPPRYDDFVPFAKHLVAAFPDRVLWGTDWPHPNMKSHMPDDGNLIDMIPRIAPTNELQQRLLVDNPMRLYWGSVLPGQENKKLKTKT
ncbi:MAG: amidohydrolase family protein [Granulosicoccus sp.]